MKIVGWTRSSAMVLFANDVKPAALTMPGWETGDCCRYLSVRDMQSVCMNVSSFGDERFLGIVVQRGDE